MMQQGFDAHVEAPEPGSGNPLFAGTRIFWMASGSRTNVVLLDDKPVVGRRHRLNLPGNKQSKGIRLTCARPDSKEQQPRHCLACEAMLRHGDVIKRRFTSNLSVIDEAQFVAKRSGKTYKDMKYLLELDWAYHQVFAEQMKAHGTLSGMRFLVMRPTGPPQNTKTFGDSWTPMGIVDPRAHFWQSPAIPRIVEFARNSGKQLSHEQAVADLVKPIDYSRELDNYSPELAEMFITYALGRWSQDEQQTSYHQAPATAAAAMPAQSVPSYTAAPQPSPSVPVATVPPVTPMAPQPPAQPPQATPPAPMQPPHVADPAGATPPAMGAPAPAPFPVPGSAPAPAAPPVPTAPQAPPVPMAPPQPVAPAAQPQPQPAAAPGVDQYSFDGGAAGWSPSFPGSAPGAAPAAPAAPPAPQAPRAPAAPVVPPPPSQMPI